MEISVEGSKTKSLSLDLKTLYQSEVGNIGASVQETSSWLGNGAGTETKKRKNRKELAISGFDDLTQSKKIRNSIDDIEVDDAENCFPSLSSGLDQNINGDSAIGIDISGDSHNSLIRKRPRGSGGRSKVGKSHLLNSTASVENFAELKDELKEVLQNEVSDSSIPEIVKLNGKVGVKSRTKEKGSKTVALSCHEKNDGGDLVKSVGLLDSEDEVVQLKDKITEIPLNKVPDTADDAPVSDSSLISKDKASENKDDQMGKLNENSNRNTSKNMELDGSDENQKQKKVPVAIDSFHHANEESTDVVSSYKDSSSKRNGSSRMKRKRMESSNETVVKKIESSAVDLDPDDDLEQNAAFMLSSRFDPNCTGFASKNTTEPLLPANEGKEERLSGSEEPTAASFDSQDRALHPRRHQKGKGASRKRRHFYEIHSDDMDAHWFLNRKIKIFWPLDESWYYGLVNDYDAEKNLHHIKYDDRDEEWISLENERFKLLLLPSELPHKPNSLNYTTPSEKRRSTSVHIKDEALMESEPIISWFAHHRVKSTTSTSLRKQNTFVNTPVEDDRSNTGIEDEHLPIVYFRKRRYHRFNEKVDTIQQLIQCNKFEICIPLWPMLTYHVLGVDILWLIRSVFLLQFGTMVTIWPTVFLEVLFVDNIVGLRLFMFEGCLKQAVAFVFLVMKVFCETEKDESIDHQIPVTTIRFKLSFFHNFRNHKVFAYYSFSKVRDFNWRYLDSVFRPHCLLSKRVSLSECTYDNIKLLEDVTQTTHIPYAGQTEVFHKKSNRVGVPLISNSRSFKPVSGIRSIYSLMHGNISPFALSFTSAPNLFINLHLKLLLDRSITLSAAADDDDDDNDDDYSQFEISSETSSSKSSSHENSQANNQPSRQLNDPTISNLKGIISVEIPTSDEVHNSKQQDMSDLAWNLSDGIICSPNQHSTGPKRSLWHHQKPFGDPSDFFGNGPKKPRTQVQYTMPYSSKNKGHNNLPYQRIRKTNDKKTPISPSDTATAAKSGGPRRNLELVACDANILINGGDKGWRECGARVFLEADQQNEWKLAVKCSGELRYAYKVHQDLQPGSTNRFTHAMMWKGGKDWALEFPDRGQWFVFKELHEECHNRNIRAASIKNIPIPGVRMIQADDHYQKEESFTRTPWYLRQVRDDVEMAMDGSRVMYDMDSEDEEWVCRNRSKGDDNDIISDELFEKVMDMLEKVSFAQKRDQFSSEEIDDLIAKVSSLQIAKSIYDYWREKRQRKGLPLVRQLQPPLWEKYQQSCREWEKVKPKPTGGSVSGSQEKASAGIVDKPPMFAFCLKPRGLELLNRGSKHRPHKKISLSGHNLAADHDPHHFSGRRVNTYGFVGDERAESSDASPLLVSKTYSPRDPGPFSLDGSDDWYPPHQLRIHNSKSIRTLVSPKPGLRKSSVKRSNSKKFSSNDWHSNQTSAYRMMQQQPQLVLGGSDLDEFRLRDASSAAKHARNMAKLKRERAEKLMLSADLAIHKAVAALMTAEAIKASCTGGDYDDEEESSSPPSTTMIRS